MRRFYKLVALCLAVLWLPATMCCALEEVGLKEICSTDSCCDDDASAAKACCAVDSGGYHAENTTLKVQPRLVDLCACLVCTTAWDVSIETSRLVAAPGFARPADWLPNWQFERRAAAPAHAPDGLSA